VAEVQYIVNYVWLKYGVDARAGLAFNYFADVMNALIQLSGLGSAVAVSSVSLHLKTTPIGQLFPYFANSVPILGIKGVALNGIQAM
jgi:hypothetical protein